MATYGFTVDVNGNVLSKLKQIEDAINKMSNKVQHEVKNVNEHFKSMADQARKVGEVIAGAFAFEKIYEFGKEILHTTAEFQGFENVIRYSSISIQDAAANLDYIGKAADRLHLPIKEAYQSFSEMQAGFYGTGVEGQKLRDVFEGVSEASTVLHLSADKFSNVTFALKEIGELGTVQSRQMRMLAFALPGAMNIAAKSMHMSTEEFHKAMRKGLINSGDFLQKFSKSLKEHFEGGLANAGNSLISRMNDAKNSVIKLFLKIGNDLEPVFAKILSGIQIVIGGLSHLWDWMKANASTIRSVAIAVSVLVAGFALYNTYVAIAAARTAILAWWNGASAAAIVFNTLATEGLSAAWAAFTMVLDANPIAWIIGLLVALVAAALYCWDKFKGFREFLGGFWGAFMAGLKGTFDLMKNLGAIIYDIFTGHWGNIGKDLMKGLDEFKKDFSIGISKAIQKGAEDAGNSTFKFGDLLKFNTGQKGPITNPQGGSSPGGGQMGKNALNTSALAGAKGGLGEAKVINIHIDTMQKVNVADGRQLKERGQDAVEVMLRTLNNVAYSQTSSQ